ncbi:hypothetical protein Tco_0560997 [Tanacetum coccineum]
MKAFPLSLSKNAKKWWMNKGDGNNSTWKELVKKFFNKLYPQSCASNYDKMYADNEKGLLNDEVSSDEEWEEHEYENPPNDSFPKPYLNINHHNENNGDADKSRGMDLSGASQYENISNEQRNEGIYRIDKFKMIKYTIGGTIRRILGIGIWRIDPRTVDLAETMIWYILKRTCVELIQALVNPLFAQELILENYHQQNIREFSVLILFSLII